MLVRSKPTDSSVAIPAGVGHRLHQEHDANTHAHHRPLHRELIREKKSVTLTSSTKTQPVFLLLPPPLSRAQPQKHGTREMTMLGQQLYCGVNNSPCMFPLGEPFGEFMSAWASHQSTLVSGLALRTPAKVPKAMEWSPPRVKTNFPSAAFSKTASESRRHPAPTAKLWWASPPAAAASAPPGGPVMSLELQTNGEGCQWLQELCLDVLRRGCVWRRFLRPEWLAVTDC